MKKKQQYTHSFKENAVNQAIELNNIRQVSEKLGITYNILRGWIKLSKEAKSKGKSLSEELSSEAQIKALEKRNKELMDEVAILKKRRRILQRNCSRKIRLDRDRAKILLS